MMDHELPYQGDKIGRVGHALRRELAYVVSKCERDAMIAGGTVPDGTWTLLKAQLTAAIAAIEATEAAP